MTDIVLHSTTISPCSIDACYQAYDIHIIRLYNYTTRNMAINFPALFKFFIASPKGEANNRIRRKKSHVTLSVCMYVCNAP